MIKVKNIKLLGILLAVLVIFLGVRPLFTQTITNDSIASAINFSFNWNCLYCYCC